MALYITQTYARIGEEPRQSLSLELSRHGGYYQRHAKVNISTELPRVIIDQSEAFASAGLKSNEDMVRKELKEDKNT